MWALRLRFVALVLALLALGGCAREEIVSLPHWQMETPSGTTHTVDLPAHVDGLLPRAECTYRLHADAPLGPSFRGHVLTLAIPYIPAKVHLFVAGHEIPPLDTERAGDYRSAGSHRYQLPAALTNVEALPLELVVDHRWTQSGWLDSIPRLSATPYGDAKFLFARDTNVAFGVGGCAAVLVVAFMYTMLHLFANRHPSAKWFAIEAAAASAYPAFTLGITQRFFGTNDTGVMGFSLVVAAYASVNFVNRHVGLGPPSRLWLWGLMACSAVYVFAHGPFTMTYYGAPFTIVIMMCNSTYQLLILRRMLKEGRPQHVWLVPLVWPCATIVAGTDVLAWLGTGELFGGLRLGSFGIGIVSLFQAVVLTREYILSSQREGALNAELAGRVALLETTNREVQTLNDELRRQIGARSEELVDLLRRFSLGKDRAPRALARGDVVDSRYEVLRVLGAGGMGVVHEVKRLSDGRPLALKILAVAGGDADSWRFAREAQIVSRLNHPNVVSIVDVNIATTGHLYLVMELVAGRSLHDQGLANRPLPWTLSVLRQIALALEAIHQGGIVHRDLKPANVLLAEARPGEPPVAKLSDFGISRIAVETAIDTSLPPPPVESHAPRKSPPLRIATSISSGIPVLSMPPSSQDGATMSIPRAPTTGFGQNAFDNGDRSYTGEAQQRGQHTQAGAMLGTPRYMAPELATGANGATSASDMFSFGVIAYELLVGDVPHGEAALTLRLQGKPLPAPLPLATQCPQLPASVARMLEACVSEAVDERPTAVEAARALSTAAVALVESSTSLVAG